MTNKATSKAVEAASEKNLRQLIKEWETKIIRPTIETLLEQGLNECYKEDVSKQVAELIWEKLKDSVEIAANKMTTTYRQAILDQAIEALERVRDLAVKKAGSTLYYESSGEEVEAIDIDDLDTIIDAELAKLRGEK